MKKKIYRMIHFIVCAAIICSCTTITGFAANTTTMEAIPQSTTAAINYLTTNVGTINGKYRIPGLMLSLIHI